MLDLRYKQVETKNVTYKHNQYMYVYPTDGNIFCLNTYISVFWVMIIVLIQKREFTKLRYNSIKFLCIPAFNAMMSQFRYEKKKYQSAYIKPKLFYVPTKSKYSTFVY